MSDGAHRVEIVEHELQPEAEAFFASILVKSAKLCRFDVFPRPFCPDLSVRGPWDKLALEQVGHFSGSILVKSAGSCRFDVFPWPFCPNFPPEVRVQAFGRELMA
jgi:hypothetical protein